MKNRILILGAAGLLGEELTKELSGDFEVKGLDRPEIDITNRVQIRDIFNNYKPSIIINTAAINAVDDIESDSELFKTANQVNSIAVGEIAKIADELGVIFVHFSTDYVFSGDNINGYDENSTVSPISKYGQTKAGGEEELIKNTKRYYLIRLSRLFGSPSKSVGAKVNFVEKILNIAFQKDILELVDEERSSPTYAPDLAKFVKKLIIQKAQFGIFHGANSGSCTWYEFGKEILKQSGVSVNVVSVDGQKFMRAAKRPKYSVLLNTKMPPQRLWQEALQEYLKLPK